MLSEQGQGETRRHDLGASYLILIAFEGHAVGIPGYFDELTRTFRPWDDVILPANKLPGWGDVRYTGDPFVRHSVAIGAPVEPKIAFTASESEAAVGVALGYYDSMNRSFYRWNGVWMSTAQWERLKTTLAPACDWINVDPTKIDYMRTIDVPRYHARWAVEAARMSGSAAPAGIRVAPDIDIRAGMTTIPVDRSR